jgi:hypothetical protein
MSQISGCISIDLFNQYAKYVVNYNEFAETIELPSVYYDSVRKIRIKCAV